MYWSPADGSGEAEPLLVTSAFKLDPHSWSPDGTVLAYFEITEGSFFRDRDIWTLPLEGDRDPVPFLVTPFNERSPSFSPNGRWIAYASDESGQDEVYVQPYPGPGAKVPVSTDGGREPVWSRNGKELFYWNEDRLMAVDVETAATFSAGRPRLLFEAPHITVGGPAGAQGYDISPDGQRFLLIQPSEASTEMHVVLNWFQELKRLVPTDN